MMMRVKDPHYASDAEQLLAEVVDEGICVQCGTCVASCPDGCLEMVGQNPFPALVPDGAYCIDCGKCLQVCPRRATEFDDINRYLFGRAPDAGEVAGVVESYWAGHVADDAVWRNAAGGGIVSGLTIDLLESGQVDGVVMCGPDSDQPGGIVARVVTNRQEMMANAGSHYRVVPINALLQELAGTGDQRFALVGTGCHISGLRKLQMVSRLWQRKVVLAIGLMCGMNLSPTWSDHLIADLGIDDPAQIKSFRYRGWGGAGAEADMEPGETIALRQYFGFQMIRLAPLYMLEGCSLCLDLYAEHADLTVGDYKKGTSIALARNPAGRIALEGAMARGMLDLNPVEPEESEGQSVMYDLKLRRCLTLLEGRRRDGLRVPDYGARERSADDMWDHPEDKDTFLLTRRVCREPGVQAWIKELPYWRQFRLGKLYMGLEPRRQWPGGAERSQTFIDGEGWEAFLARR
jgi:coenzyme F420 hydrogenase subunit beta